MHYFMQSFDNRIGTIDFPVSSLEKLRFGVNNLPRVTQKINGTVGISIQFY